MDSYRFHKKVLSEDADVEETKTLIRNNDSDYTETRISYAIGRTINYAFTVVLVCSIVGVWLCNIARQQQCDIGVERYYHYSPGLEATNPGSRLIKFNHTKWSPFSPSSGDPLEYADGNWTDILRVGMISLSDEELQQVGASPGSMRLPPGGGGGYMAYLASHHHLHCLYLLHQSLHPDYQTGSVVWNVSAEKRFSHWDHCIESLRQYVTCDADATVVTHNWFEHFDKPIATQENPRRCAGWDAHFRWQLDRQVHAPRQPLSKPADATERPALPSHPLLGYMSMYFSGQAS